MLALRNVKDTMLTTAKDVLRHVAAALKKVEGWLGNRAIRIFVFFELLLACWRYLGKFVTE